MHIKETDLELFAYRPESFNEEETIHILSHLDKCSLCKDIFLSYQNIYKGIIDGMSKNPDGNDEELAEQIVSKLERTPKTKLLRQENNIVKIYHGEMQIVSRPKLLSVKGVAYLLKNHPVQSFAYFSMAALLVIFSILFFKKPVQDNNPVLLKIVDDVLYAYNSSGDVQWKKLVEFPTDTIETLMNPQEGIKKFLDLSDIDNDGFNEIILTGYHFKTGLFQEDSLYCFNYDGTLRWTASPENQKYDYAPKWKRTHWVINQFLVARRSNRNILFVVAHDNSFGGCIISTLNPENGDVTSSIYHSGHVETAIHFDLNGDGNEEVIVGGISSYYKPFMMVLNSDYLMGVMPDFYSSGHKVLGNAYYYILFPISEIGKSLLQTKAPRGLETIMPFENNGVMALIRENRYDDIEFAGLQYVFNKDFMVQYITATPGYLYAFEKQKGIKVSSPDIITDYLKTYKDSLLYWNGNTFVNNPSKNVFWGQKFKFPQANP